MVMQMAGEVMSMEVWEVDIWRGGDIEGNRGYEKWRGG